MAWFWSVLGVAAAAGIAAADTVEIGFEGLTHGELVTTQYSHLGATFSGELLGPPSIVTPTPGDPYPDGPLAGQGGDNYLGPAFAWDYVNIAFDAGIKVTEFSVRGLDIGESGFRIEAYSGLTLLDSAEVFGTGTGKDQYFDLSVFVASGFDRIRIGQKYPFFLPGGGLGGDSAYAIDDVSYTYVVVPLPPAAWAGLVGLGVAAGVSRMRRMS
jgi:hypothetical protein